jgi:hypothetical protein
MPAMRRAAGGDGPGVGGIAGYPVDRVRHEVAFLGQHVNWTLVELLSLDHAERRRWLREVTAVIEAD